MDISYEQAGDLYPLGRGRMSLSRLKCGCRKNNEGEVIEMCAAHRLDKEWADEDEEE